VPPIRYLDLTEKYLDASADYQQGWAHIDSALQDVVRSHPRPVWSDTYTKVVLIDGVSRAQLTRNLGREAEENAAHALVASGAQVTSAIDQLRRHSVLSLDAVPHIMAAHTVFLQVLGPTVEARQLRSLVSKYLHFHADIVPIYDSRAAGHVRRFCTWPRYRQSLGKLGQIVPLVPGGDSAYHEFVLRFLLLFEHLSSLQPPVDVTVKGVDHMLWKG